MRCLDCTTNDHIADAVGVCSTCGAAVCADCARVGVQTIKHLAGFAAANITDTTTRKIACVPCATSLSANHANTYQFATIPERAAFTGGPRAGHRH